jgi:phosphoglycerate dehydrogenase-like enzyme
LIVGYGSIGTAAEAQLVPFGVTVERIAQEFRDDVLGPDAVPEALARADIVIILSPLTRDLRHSRRAVPGPDADHTPRSSTPPRCWPS